MKKVDKYMIYTGVIEITDYALSLDEALVVGRQIIDMKYKNVFLLNVKTKERIKLN